MYILEIMENLEDGFTLSSLGKVSLKFLKTQKHQGTVREFLFFVSLTKSEDLYLDICTR